MGATLTTKQRHGTSGSSSGSTSGSTSSSVVVVVNTATNPDHEDVTDITGGESRAEVCDPETVTRPPVNSSLLQLFDPLWPTVKLEGDASTATPAAQDEDDGDGRVVITLNLVSVAHDRKQQRSGVPLKADKATQTDHLQPPPTSSSSDQFSVLGTKTTTLSIPPQPTTTASFLPPSSTKTTAAALSRASIPPQPTTTASFLPPSSTLSWPANAWTPQYCQAPTGVWNYPNSVNQQVLPPNTNYSSAGTATSWNSWYYPTSTTTSLNNWTATGQSGENALNQSTTHQHVLPPTAASWNSWYYPTTSFDNRTPTGQSGDNALNQSTTHQNQKQVGAAATAAPRSLLQSPQQMTSSEGSWWWIPHGPAPWGLNPGSSGSLQHHAQR